jgi:hypothetical protein
MILWAQKSYLYPVYKEWRQSKPTSKNIQKIKSAKDADVEGERIHDDLIIQVLEKASEM